MHIFAWGTRKGGLWLTLYLAPPVDGIQLFTLTRSVSSITMQHCLSYIVCGDVKAVTTSQHTERNEREKACFKAPPPFPHGTVSIRFQGSPHLSHLPKKVYLWGKGQVTFSYRSAEGQVTFGKLEKSFFSTLFKKKCRGPSAAWGTPPVSAAPTCPLSRHILCGGSPCFEKGTACWKIWICAIWLESQQQSFGFWLNLFVYLVIYVKV